MSKLVTTEALLSTLELCRICLPPETDPIHFERLRYIKRILQAEIWATRKCKKSPLYPGDDFLLLEDLPAKHHTAGFYEEFGHTWILKNTGTVTWHDRRIRFTNQGATRIKTALTTARTSPATIEIPNTNPGDTVQLTARFDARGFEGTHEVIWEMEGANGRPCFPDKALSITVAVTWPAEKQ